MPPELLHHVAACPDCTPPRTLPDGTFVPERLCEVALDILISVLEAADNA